MAKKLHKYSNATLLVALEDSKAKLTEILNRKSEWDIALGLDWDEYKWYMDQHVEIVRELLKRGFDIKEINPILIGHGSSD